MALLWREAQVIDWTAAATAFVGIPVTSWLAALAAVGISFWAVAQYDVIAHRHFGTNVPAPVARGTGAAAITVAQTTGFGPAVGAALRWRMIGGLGSAKIIQVTAFVTATFCAAWAILAVGAVAPILLERPALSLLIIPCLLVLGCLTLIRFHRVRVGKRYVRLPTVRAFLSLVAFAAIDVICAGTALKLLLPPDFGPDLVTLVAAFTLALGAGMIGGTPGGVGPFEMTLIWLLPQTPIEDLAAALIAFRLVYYAVPCVFGALWALLAPRHTAFSAPELEATLTGPRPEFGIAAQNDHSALSGFAAEGVALRTPHSLALFLGPLEGSLSQLIPELRRAAREENRIPCLYKIEARDARDMRDAGWTVLPFAMEAHINPATHRLDGPQFRQLRRQVRKAEQNGVRVARLTDPDWERLTEIHSRWEDAHGAERGLTMGRFCPIYLSDKPLYGAWQGDRLIAFTSWLRSDGSMSLDVTRHMPDAPHGTMHALIHHVIATAAAHDISDISLAAVPHPNTPHWIENSAGLSRFKSSFAPTWRPLYFAAPNALAMTLCAADLRQTIVRPPPLRRSVQDLWDLDAMVSAPRHATVAPPTARQRKAI